MSGSPAVGIKDILINEGIAALVESGNAWTVKVGRILESPDKLLACFDTPGLNPNPKWLVDYPTAQVFIRGPIDGYQAAWEKAKEVKDALVGRDPETLNGDLWDAILGMGDLIFVRFDERNRPIFTMNFRLIIEPEASALSNREPL